MDIDTRRPRDQGRHAADAVVDAWRDDARLRGLQGGERRAARRSSARRRRRAGGEARAHRRAHRRAGAPARRDHAEGGAAGARRASARAAQRRALEHKAAFEAYVRTGESAGLRALEVKAMSVGSNPDGGYLVPPEIEHADRRAARPRSRRSARIAGARTISRQRLQEAVHDRGPGGRLGRRDRRAHADRLADARRAVVPGDGALRHAGGDRDAARGLAPSTSTSGSRRRSSRCSPRRRAPPSSPATAPTSRRASCPTPTVANALVDAGAISATSRPARPAPSRRRNPSDVLVDLVYAVKAGYRQNGVFVMNRKTQSGDPQVQGLDRQLSLAAAGDGGRPRLADDLPGGRGRGHAGHRGEFAVDRVRRFPPRLSGGRPRRRHACCAIRTRAKPYVLFYTTKRVGGGVQDFDAIKLMKFAAS